MSQTSLFDLPPADPMSRKQDPPTSKAAARSVDVNAREGEVVSALRWLVCASDRHDIARVLAEHGMTRETSCISRRLTSLERKGLVARCGVKVGAHGRPTSLWRLL